MDDYNLPGNSRRAREEGESQPKKPVPAEERPAVKQVTARSATRQKPGVGRKFMRTFFEGATARGIVENLVLEVLIPDARSMVYEMGLRTLESGRRSLERAIFGENRSANRAPNTFRAANTSYTSYTNRYTQQPRRPEEQDRNLSRRDRQMHNLDDIPIDTKVEGEEVLHHLFEYIETYGQATVAEFYELVGITPDATDRAWGWRGLPGADVVRDRNAWRVVLPRPVPLNQERN